jgi:hypothetical protein
LEEQTLTLLVHGEAGAGKSWLGDTAPGPRLILDAEGRAKYLPSQPKVLWDPRAGAPPRYDGTWETCVVIVPDYQTMELVYRWLQSGQHDFVSVVCDSLMEVQKRLIDRVAGSAQLDQQDWGEVFRELEKLARDYRDLVIQQSNPTRCVVFTTGSIEDKAGKWRPMLQGKLAKSLPYLVDTVGYLYTAYTPEAGVTRQMLVAPLPTAVAKDGTNELPSPTVPSPHIGQLFAQVRHSEVAGAVAVGSAQTQPVQGGEQ